MVDRSGPGLSGKFRICHPSKKGTDDNNMRLVRSLQSISPQGTNLPLLSPRASANVGLHVIQCCRRNSTTTSLTEKLPPQIPSSGSVNLTPLRGLLALHGPDAAKFLQGLITKIFPSDTEPNGMFTAFLSPQVSPLKFIAKSRDEYFSIHSYILVRHRLSD